MFGIKSLVAGNRYLIGDSCGYEIVYCTESATEGEYQGTKGIIAKVKPISPTGNLEEEYVVFENPNSCYSLYVESR